MRTALLPCWRAKLASPSGLLAVFSESLTGLVWDRSTFRKLSNMLDIFNSGEVGGFARCAEQHAKHHAGGCHRDCAGRATEGRSGCL